MAVRIATTAAMALVYAWSSCTVLVDAAFISSAHTATTRRVSISNGHVGTPFMTNSLLMSADENFDQAEDSGARGSRTNEYTLPSDAGPIASTCKLTEGQILYLISKRSDCKSARNFAEADQILDTLVKAGVYLHDKRKEWRADGNNHFGRTNDHRHREYARRGGNHGQSEDVMADIAKVVELRAQAKRKKDFFTCDDLSDKLKVKYGVHINDKKREWSLSFVNSEEGEGLISVYVPSPIVPLDDPTHTMDDESKASIQQRLTDRLVARRSKDYVLADSIRDELQEEYSVVIDDRTREWKIASGEENDRFVKEAQASQRSAFVRETKSVDVLEKGSSTNSDIDAAFSAIFEDDPIEGDAPAILAEEAAPATIEDDAPALVAEEAARAAPTEEESESQLMTLTVPILKERLRDAGLPVSGKKAELVKRLLETSN